MPLPLLIRALIPPLMTSAKPNHAPPPRPCLLILAHRGQVFPCEWGWGGGAVGLDSGVTEGLSSLLHPRHEGDVKAQNDPPTGRQL